MGIALVANIEDELILRTVKDIVEGYGSLNESEVRTHMATMSADAVEDAGAYLLGESLQLVDAKTLEVGW